MVAMRIPSFTVFLFLAWGVCGAQTQPATPPPPAAPVQSAVPSNAAAQPADPAAATNKTDKDKDDSPDDNAPIQTFVRRVDLKNVIFTVTDKHGRFVKDLKQEQIKVLDNNKPPRQVVNF